MATIELELEVEKHWIEEVQIEKQILILIQQKGWTSIEEVICVLADSNYTRKMLDVKLEQMLPEFLDKYCMDIKSGELIGLPQTTEIITFDSSWWLAENKSHYASNYTLDCDEMVSIEHESIDDKWYENDPYAKVYGSEYIEQINCLEHALLVDETGVGNFEVHSIEAGLGKSLHANRIIRNHIEFFWDGKPRSFLIVKPFQKDVEETAKFLGKHDAWHDQVLGITAKNWSLKWKNRLDELQKFQVLIITHARYIELCMDEGTRQFFTEGRHTLVIDEKVQFPIYTFSLQDYKKNVRCSTTRNA